MTQIKAKQLDLGNIEINEKGITMLDSNGEDRWLLVIDNGKFKLEPSNTSAIRRTNLDDLLDTNGSN